MPSKTTAGNGSSKQQAPPSADVSRAELEDIVKGAVSDALQDIFGGQHEKEKGVSERTAIAHYLASVVEELGSATEAFFESDLKKTEAKYDLIKSLAKGCGSENIEFKIRVEI